MPESASERLRLMRTMFVNLDNDGAADFIVLFPCRKASPACSRSSKLAVLETTKEFTNAVSARTSANGIVLEINRLDPLNKTQALTVRELVAHYRHRELVPDNAWKTHSTNMAYQNDLQQWIIPRWGEYRLNQIKPIEVSSPRLQRKRCLRRAMRFGRHRQATQKTRIPWDR